MSKLDLFAFVPFRLNRLAAEISMALSTEYRERHNLDIPEWRVIATLGFRGRPCTAQAIAQSTRTHKSTISRAVVTLLKRGAIARIENASDRREYGLKLTRDGATLYRSLVPRLLRKEADILACLSAAERRQFDRALSKIEDQLKLTRDANIEDPARQ